MYELTPGPPSQPPHRCPWPGGLSWPQLPCPGWLPAVDEGEGERAGLGRRRPCSGAEGGGYTRTYAQVHLSSQLSSRLVTHLSSGPAGLLLPACARWTQEGDPGSVPRDPQRSSNTVSGTAQPSCQHGSHTARHTCCWAHAYLCAYEP